MERKRVKGNADSGTYNPVILMVLNIIVCCIIQLYRMKKERKKERRKE
jgi:hypothetical protein